MKIIGLVGIKRSGKTTAANHLVEKYGAVRCNFKDALIEELKEKFPELLSYCAQTYSCTVDQLFIDKPEPIRFLLQNYGTNVRRADDPNYWVNKWTQMYWDKYQDKLVVVDDVRFLNEASRIKGQAGTLIRLERTDMKNTDQHISEQEQYQIKCDHTITCKGGDLEHLYAELDAIMRG